MTDRELHTQLRLLVDTGQAANTTRQDLAAAARVALGEGWRVARLFPHSPEQLLTRHWVLTGDVPVSPTRPFAPLAFDLAATLADHLGHPVEPDLPSSAFGVEPDAGGLRGAVFDGTPADDLPGSAEQDWALRKINALRAWERAVPPGGSSRGRGVLIGHIDTGYTDHPDLERDALELTRDLDVVDGDDDARDPLVRRWWFPLDRPGHGTRTGSVIASRVTREIVGTAPEATLLPVRAVQSVVQVLDADVARAVDHARRSGCHVITMSLGGRGFVGLQDAITLAVADGIIVMAAAGNQVRFVVAPAVYPECLAVAASNADDKPWAGSSRGDAVDISAPGESVWTAWVDSSVQPPRFDSLRGNGTSFAVAHLAGVAALWLAFHGPDTIRRRYGRERTQAAFLSLVRRTCRTPAGWDRRQYGAGIVDADALLAAELPSDAPDTAPVAPEFDPLRRITAAVPELSRATAITGLAGRFGVDRDALPDVLRQHSSELVYLLGENVDLSGVLSAPTPGLSLAARNGHAATPLISRHLAAALAGSPVIH